MTEETAKGMLVSISAQATWEIRHKVLWPSKPFDYIKLPADEEGLHFGYRDSTRLVSVLSLFLLDEGEAQFRKFATLPTEQGKGYGTQLLEHVIQEVEKRGIKRLWCNARQETAAFYKKFGMRETDTRFFKGEIPYVVMEKRF